MAQPNYSMDRRNDSRITSNHRVIVTNLSQARISFRCELANASPCGLGLRTVLPLETGTLMSVEWHDTLVLGQIVYCRRSNGKYQAGLKVEYVIHDRTSEKRPEQSVIARSASDH